jgi:hypothetical protein
MSYLQWEDLDKVLSDQITDIMVAQENVREVTSDLGCLG